MGLIMKFISFIFFLFLLFGCTTQSMNEKGDIYSLRINSVEDFEKYKNKIQRLEKKFVLKNLPSYNEKGLHVFIDNEMVSGKVYYFIPEVPSKESFYIDNISGTNTCGKLTFEEGKQEEIFKYGVENFPYLDVYRDGKFPFKGDKHAYFHILGYRQMDNGERKYFSYYLFKEYPVGKNKIYLTNFPPFPKIIDEYVEFLKTIGSAESSPVTRDACRNLY